MSEYIVYISRPHKKEPMYIGMKGHLDGVYDLVAYTGPHDLHTATRIRNRLHTRFQSSVVTEGRFLNRIKDRALVSLVERVAKEEIEKMRGREEVNSPPLPLVKIHKYHSWE